MKGGFFFLFCRSGGRWAGTINHSLLLGGQQVFLGNEFLRLLNQIPFCGPPDFSYIFDHNFLRRTTAIGHLFLWFDMLRVWLPRRQDSR